MNSLFKDEDFEQTIHISNDSVLCNGRIYNYTYFIKMMIWPIDQNNPDVIDEFEPGTDITKAFLDYNKQRKIVFEFHHHHPEDVARVLHTTVEHVLRLSAAEELGRYKHYIDNISNKQKCLKIYDLSFTEMVNQKIDIFQYMEDRHLYCDDDEGIAVMKSAHVYQDLFLYKMRPLRFDRIQ